jgi:hypothetical protein
MNNDCFNAVTVKCSSTSFDLCLFCEFLQPVLHTLQLRAQIRESRSGPTFTAHVQRIAVALRQRCILSFSSWLRAALAKAGILALLAGGLICSTAPVR